MACVIRILLVLFFSVSIAGSAFAAAMTCGNKFIFAGMTMDDVLAYCGEPDQAELQDDVVPGISSWRGRHTGRIYSWDFYLRVTRERWIYNYGRTKFMKILIFENGFLREILTGPYGY